MPHTRKRRKSARHAEADFGVAGGRPTNCKLAILTNCKLAIHLRSMTVVAVAGAKGGGGKSTLVVNLASELRARGHRVVVIDADEQGTVLTWAEVATTTGRSAPPVVVMGDNLRSHVPSVAEDYDWTIIDCPGRGGRRQAAAILVSDFVLVPCTPSAADTWSLGTTLDVLEEAQELRPDLLAAIVVNRADRTLMTSKAKGTLSTVPLPILETSLGDRVAFREAMAAGSGVTEYARHSVAAEEVRNLVDELIARLSQAA